MGRQEEKTKRETRTDSEIKKFFKDYMFYFEKSKILIKINGFRFAI